MSEPQTFADLHVHTNHSDGYYSPKKVVDKALAHNLAAISIVDHDEIGALAEATAYAEPLGLEVIAGVELSVNYEGHDLHLLGYCFDPEYPELLNYLQLFKEERLKRAKKIVQKLTKMGMPVSYRAVLEKAGEGSVGRPHIANVMIEGGFVASFQEAFNRFIGWGKPAYVDKYKMDVETAMRIIKSAGGVCIIAHPAIQLKNRDLINLIKAGVDGIEVVHPKHSSTQVEYYRNLVRENSLLATGGSDFHGGPKGEDFFGKYKIDYSAVQAMRAYAGGV